TGLGYSVFRLAASNIFVELRYQEVQVGCGEILPTLTKQQCGRGFSSAIKSGYIPPGTEQALSVNTAVHFRIKKGATYMIDLLVFAVSPDQAVRNMAQVAVS